MAHLVNNNGIFYQLYYHRKATNPMNMHKRSIAVWDGAPDLMNICEAVPQLSFSQLKSLHEKHMLELESNQGTYRIAQLSIVEGDPIET